MCVAKSSTGGWTMPAASPVVPRLIAKRDINLMVEPSTSLHHLDA